MGGGGIVGTMAGGGVVGNGIFGVDSVRARYAGGGDIALAGGEFVMPSLQTARFAPQLDAMRTGTYSNDNGSVVNELRRNNELLLARIDKLEKRLMAVTAAGASEVREGIDAGNELLDDTNKRLRRQSKAA
jgi:hypothetical protein